MMASHSTITDAQGKEKRSTRVELWRVQRGRGRGATKTQSSSSPLAHTQTSPACDGVCRGREMIGPEDAGGACKASSGAERQAHIGIGPSADAACAR